MRLPLLLSVALLLAGRIFAEVVPLKAEVLPGQVIDQNAESRVKIRLTNTSSEALGILKNPHRNWIDDPYNCYHISVHTLSGQEILPPPRDCGGSFGEPLSPVSEEFTVTLAPGQTLETTVQFHWKVPEDGAYKVRFTYGMPGYLLAPKGVWYGGARAEEVVLQFKAHKDVNPREGIPYYSVERLSKMLDVLQPGGMGGVAAIVQRLHELHDLAAVPALNRAAERGFIEETAKALGDLGNEHSFEILLQGYAKSPEPKYFTGLAELVNRSNKTREWWMGIGNRVSLSSEEVRAFWLTWWNENEATFRIVKAVPKPPKPFEAERVYRPGTTSYPHPQSGLTWPER